MAFTVTKLSQSLVVPDKETPASTFLPLSSIDRHPSHRVWIDSVYVFKHGVDPASVFRRALARALVPYYPMAGRFVESEEGVLQVACTGDGVWFVEARAECSLEDVNYLQSPLMVARDDILPCPPDPVNDLKSMTVMMQVTQFTCGGFAIGVKQNHAIADGLGALQYMNAISDIARGLTEPKIQPIWCREAIPGPKEHLSKQPIAPRNPPSIPLHDFTIDFSPDQINKLKEQFTNQTGSRCSTLDVLFAKVWQCRTRALGLCPETRILLHFFADARRLLHKVLPEEGRGYYGNCIYPVKVIAASGKIAGDSMVEVVKLIREAKERLPAEFAKWADGELEEDPNEIEFSYQSFFVVDWSRMGLSEVDFGWGPPVYAGPLMTDVNTIPMSALLKPPAPKVGTRLMTWCVEPRHFAAFQDQMMNWE